MRKNIFIWDNTGKPEWHIGIAICEDGHILAQHCSSSVGFLKQDMGLFPERCKWKHDKYQEHCPEGYELHYVEHDDPRLTAALKLNEQLALEKKPTTDVSDFVKIETTNA